MAGRVDHAGDSPLEGHYRIPEIFRKHPLNRWLTADEVVKSVAWLWEHWSPNSQAYREVSYLLDHYEGDFDGSPSSLSDSRI